MKQFAALLLFFVVSGLDAASVGGRVAPDGTEIQIDLPGRMHQANISSKGLGCCVFRSLDHAARWANVPALVNMPEWMLKKGIAGGGWPEKVDKLVPQIAKDRGLPAPEFVHITGKDVEALKAACRSGRMVSVTYSRSPTGRYNGKRIAHMVNVVHADEKWVCVLDNNYPGADAYEWMSWDEFSRVCNPGGYWATVLLTHGPPPLPWN